MPLGKKISVEDRRAVVTGARAPANELEEEVLARLELVVFGEVALAAFALRANKLDRVITVSYSNALNPDQPTGWFAKGRLKKLLSRMLTYSWLMPKFEAKHLAEPALFLGLVKAAHPEFSRVVTREAGTAGRVHVDLIFEDEVFDSSGHTHGVFGALEAYAKMRWARAEKEVARLSALRKAKQREDRRPELTEDELPEF